MGFKYTLEEVVNSFNAVKGDVLDFSYLTITVLLGPFYLYSLFYEDAITVGFILNALVLTGLVTIVVLKKKTTIRIKTGILLFVLLCGNLYSIYRYGFFGGAQYFMILIFGLTAFYFKRALAVSINIGVVVYFFVLMYLYTTGKLQYEVATDALVMSRMVWLSDFVLTIMVIAIGGYAIRKTFLAYRDNVNEQIESLKKFNYTLESMPIPVAALGVDKKIHYFNEAFFRYFGFEKEEIPDFASWLSRVYPDVNRRREVREYSEKLMSEGFKEQRQQPIEYHDFVTKNGEEKSVEVHHTILGDVAICAFVDLTERKRKRREIVEGMMKSEAKENKRIAQELHDGVGPLLSTVKIYAHSLSRNLPDPEQQELGVKLNELIDGAIKELRNTINNVSPQILQKYGLIRAVESFVTHIQPITNIRFTLELEELLIQDPFVELAIYRALLELINNTIKYGESENVRLTVKTSGEGIKVFYADDGIGFEFERERTKGFGLSNIINRIETIGGTVCFNSGVGAGVQVEITFKRINLEK